MTTTHLVCKYRRHEQHMNNISTDGYIKHLISLIRQYDNLDGANTLVSYLGTTPWPAKRTIQNARRPNQIPSIGTRGCKKSNKNSSSCTVFSILSIDRPTLCPAFPFHDVSPVHPFQSDVLRRSVTPLHHFYSTPCGAMRCDEYSKTSSPSTMDDHRPWSSAKRSSESPAKA